MSEDSENQIQSSETEADAVSAVSYISAESSEESSETEDQSQESEPLIRYTEYDKRSAATVMMIPRWLLSLIVMIMLIVWNILIEWLGSLWFWSQQLMYWLSLAGIFIGSFSLMIWGLRRDSLPPRSLVVVALFSTLIAAIVLSVMKFINTSVFWTFFNLITQPLNALALSLLAIWLAFKLSNWAGRRA